MSRRSRRTRRTAAALVAVMIAAGAPGAAFAKPAGEGLGPHAEKFVNPPAQTVVNPPQEKFVSPPAQTVVNPPQEKFVSPAAEFAGEPSTPAPTVVRTVVQGDSTDVLPIALAGAALLIVIGGTGYALMRVAPRQRLGGQH
jgi:hypothetical protein